MDSADFSYLRPTGWLILGIALLSALSIIVVTESGMTCIIERHSGAFPHYSTTGPMLFCHEGTYLDLASAKSFASKSIFGAGPKSATAVQVLLGFLVLAGALGILLFRDRDHRHSVPPTSVLASPQMAVKQPIAHNGEHSPVGGSVDPKKSDPSSAPLPPSGWYRSPIQPWRRQYWDGSSWGDMEQILCPQCEAPLKDSPCQECGASPADRKDG
jgi:hypothetical protein